MHVAGAPGLSSARSFAAAQPSRSGTRLLAGTGTRRRDLLSTGDMQTGPLDRGEGSIRSMASPHRTGGDVPTTRRVNHQTLPRVSSEPPSIWPDSGITTLEVRGVYRNPDSIDNCNRGRISSPGLDLGTSTGGNRQPVGVWGSFPRIAVKLQSDCSEIALCPLVWPACPGSGQ